MRLQRLQGVGRQGGAGRGDREMLSDRATGRRTPTPTPLYLETGVPAGGGGYMI
jgi:hypothetical protein